MTRETPRTVSTASDQILTRRTAALLILIGGAMFCAFLTLLILIDPADRVVTGASSYSRSAVGHAALAGLLREAGYDVEVNRSRRGRGIAAGDVLLILDPDLQTNTVADLQRLIEGKRRVLLALPKWDPLGSATPKSRGWISDASLRPIGSAGMAARAVVLPASVERPEAEQTWIDQLGLGTPTVEGPQLLTDTRLEPLIATASGILAGKTSYGDQDETTVVLMSDPDLLANHGLHRGDNARLSLGLIRRLLPSSGATIYFDESLHGFAIVPSLARLLLAPPFLAVTLLVLGTVAITVWRAAVGFGTPGSPSEPGPVFGSGHETLLRNAGRLLAAGDHGSFIAERYGRASLEDAARRLHLAGQRRQGDNEADLRGILHGIASRRGVRTRLPGAGTHRPLVKARRYYDWMEEMFGGSGSNRDAR